MAVHGWQKLTMMGPANFGNDMLAGLGIPAPVLFGYVVTFTELIGGLLLIVGLLTRVVTIPLMIILGVATLAVKTDIGLIAGTGAPLPGAELDLALIAGLLTLLLLGPGPLSLDRALGIEDTVPTVSAPARGSGGRSAPRRAAGSPAPWSSRARSAPRCGAGGSRACSGAR
jgi:putative oxidoreductase